MQTETSKVDHRLQAGSATPISRFTRSELERDLTWATTKQDEIIAKLGQVPRNSTEYTQIWADELVLTRLIKKLNHEIKQLPTL